MRKRAGSSWLPARSLLVALGLLGGGLDQVQVEIKSLSLDPALVEKVCPVSTLDPLLGKVVGARLQRVLDEASYPDPSQSGFRSVIALKWG